MHTRHHRDESVLSEGASSLASPSRRLSRRFGISSTICCILCNSSRRCRWQIVHVPQEMNRNVPTAQLHATNGLALIPRTAPIPAPLAMPLRRLFRAQGMLPRLFRSSQMDTFFTASWRSFHWSPVVPPRATCCTVRVLGSSESEAGDPFVGSVDTFAADILKDFGNGLLL